MRISDWSSDVCSSDLLRCKQRVQNDPAHRPERSGINRPGLVQARHALGHQRGHVGNGGCRSDGIEAERNQCDADQTRQNTQHLIHSIASSCFMECGSTLRTCTGIRSEEHTSELQSLMRISYAVFCLKKNKNTK